jgi:hypothetical protein
MSWAPKTLRGRTKGKRLSKAKPVIRTSIFAFKVERKTIAHDRDLKGERVFLDRRGRQDNLDLRVQLGRLAERF